MTTGNPTPEPKPQVLLRAFEHRHELVHLLYTANDEADALRRIGTLLDIDQDTAAAITRRALGDMLPENRARLEDAAESS
jgi:hypothetical protein